MKQVMVVVGGSEEGTTHIVPFSHDGGLQFHVVGGVRTDQAVVYKVPFYLVTVAAKGVYRAIRFGLQNNGTAPKTRTCDAGLSLARICEPTWVSGYSPHSFSGSSRAGALRLIPKQAFLVHEGADSTKGQVGGSLGCIEILDGRWDEFLAEIEAAGGTRMNRLANAGGVRVRLETAPFPQAVLL